MRFIYFCLFQDEGQYGANFWRSGFLIPLAEEILAVYDARVAWAGAAAAVPAGAESVRKGTDFIPRRLERGRA